MKKTIALFVAIMVFMGIVTAVGCGTVNETTGATTQTTMTTTVTTTPTTKESTTERTTQTTTITETETIDTSTAILDPTLPLPDPDNPIIDVEPNVPESGTTDNGALGDIMDNIGNDMRSRKRESGSREKHRKNNISDSMMPTK